MLLKVCGEYLPASVVLVGVYFLEVSHEGVEDFHGKGEFRVRDVFEAAEGYDVFDWFVVWGVGLVCLDEIGREVYVWVAK